MLSRWVVPTARRLGLRVESPTAGVWLVQSPRAGRDPINMRAIDESTWLCERRQKRRMLRVGEPEARTDLLVDEASARTDMHHVQKGLSDWLLAEQVAWVLRELDINCVLDVGANIGQFARSVRRAGYQGRIVSFEPLPALVEKLTARAARDHDWRVFDCGLGDADAEAQINVTPGTMSSLLEPSPFGKQWSARLRDMQPQTIQLRRLDSVFDEATARIPNPRVYLKMDTQGYDLQTFRGAGDRLADVLGMQSEVSCIPIYDGMPRLPEQLSEYESAGFELAGMFPVTRHRATMRVIEFDVVLIRADAKRARH